MDWQSIPAAEKTAAAQIVCDRLDPKHPAAPELIARAEAEGAPAGAAAFVAHLRARPAPHLGWSRAYVAEVRRLATAADRRRAAERLETTLTGRAGPHSGIGALNVEAEDLFLAGDAAFCRRLAAAVLAAREGWDSGVWGVTAALCRCLRKLLVLPECPPEAAVPVLAWLVRQIDPEWAWARTWGGTMLGDTGHNWWQHTFFGFYQAGLCLPELRGLAQFRALAPEWIEEETRMLFEPDGFSKERSGYHYGSVRHALEAAALAGANGVVFSEAFRQRLRAIGATLWKTLAPNGDMPRVGDCGPAHQPGKGFPMVRLVSALLDLPEGKYALQALGGEEPLSPAGLLPWQGRNLLPAYRRLRAARPAGTPETELPDSGYYFMRQDWSPESDWAAIDAGTRGTIVSSHDHTAIFGLELYSRGTPVLLDNCSGPYGQDPARLWRVGSAAHNVATVDGEDHLPVTTEWRWGGVVRPWVNRWLRDPACAYFSGAHEGYTRLAAPVPSSRRKLFYLRGRYWILIDRFVPADETDHEYTQHFHCALPGDLAGDGAYRTAGAAGNLLLRPVGDGVEAAVEPCPQPLERYENPDHLTYTRRGRGPALFVTVLVPFRGAEAPEVAVRPLEVRCDGRSLAAHEATALALTIDGEEHTYVDLHMEWNLPWQAGEARGEGRLYHSAVGTL